MKDSHSCNTPYQVSCFARSTSVVTHLTPPATDIVTHLLHPGITQLLHTITCETCMVTTNYLAPGWSAHLRAPPHIVLSTGTYAQLRLNTNVHATARTLEEQPLDADKDHQ